MLLEKCRNVITKWMIYENSLNVERTNHWIWNSSFVWMEWWHNHRSMWEGELVKVVNPQSHWKLSVKMNNIFEINIPSYFWTFIMQCNIEVKRTQGFTCGKDGIVNMWKDLKVEKFPHTHFDFNKCEEQGILSRTSVKFDYVKWVQIYAYYQ